jgi:uncharacterized protein DUF1963
MSIHERLDLARWVERFPLSRLRAEARQYVLERHRKLPDLYPDAKAIDDHIALMSPEWDIVVGPAAVAVNEQLRAEAIAAGARPNRPIPTDVVVWSTGEPTHRAVTKTGGLPYRPANAAWPADGRGEPLRFIGQLCFADSRDILPKLPADVLLVFGDEDALLAEPERLFFEWRGLTDAPLVSEVPAVDDVLVPFHGSLHRTSDWEDAIFEGTKIGGRPRFIQDVPDVSGAFVGAIGSISVATDQEYPFINVAEPRGWSQENELMIGDMGSLYLFVHRDGSVEAVGQCY